MVSLTWIWPALKVVNPWSFWGLVTTLFKIVVTQHDPNIPARKEGRTWLYNRLDDAWVAAKLLGRKWLVRALYAYFGFILTCAYTLYHNYDYATLLETNQKLGEWCNDRPAGATITPECTATFTWLEGNWGAHGEGFKHALYTTQLCGLNSCMSVYRQITPAILDAAAIPLVAITIIVAGGLYAASIVGVDTARNRQEEERRRAGSASGLATEHVSGSATARPSATIDAK